MEKVLIGCPIYKRAWILEHWFRCIENQTHSLEDIGFIFELAPDDKETHDALLEWKERHPEVSVFDMRKNTSVLHSTHPEGARAWTAKKYHNMVKLRNDLLDNATVRSDQFDYYFSLDSDLLIEDPNTISQLIEDCQDPNVHVVSPLSYMMQTNKSYPSIMYWMDKPGRKAVRRHDLFRENELYQVDIVMAAVFMTKPVFTTVRYSWHLQGEDLGFATNLNERFKSFADTRIYANHIMHQANLRLWLNGEPDTRKPQQLI